MLWVNIVSSGTDRATSQNADVECPSLVATRASLRKPLFSRQVPYPPDQLSSKGCQVATNNRITNRRITTT